MHCGLIAGFVSLEATHAKELFTVRALTMKLFSCSACSSQTRETFSRSLTSAEYPGCQRFLRGEHRKRQSDGQESKRRGTANRYERNWLLRNHKYPARFIHRDRRSAGFSTIPIVGQQARPERRSRGEASLTVGSNMQTIEVSASTVQLQTGVRYGAKTCYAGTD